MRMISGFGYRNPEGYPDPTAYSAINNVETAQIESKTSPEDEERFHKLLNTIFTICELAERLRELFGSLSKVVEPGKPIKVTDYRCHRDFYVRAEYTYIPIFRRNMPYHR